MWAPGLVLGELRLEMETILRDVTAFSLCIWKHYFNHTQISQYLNCGFSCMVFLPNKSYINLYSFDITTNPQPLAKHCSYCTIMAVMMLQSCLLTAVNDTFQNPFPGIKYFPNTNCELVIEYIARTSACIKDTVRLVFNLKNN